MFNVTRMAIKATTFGRKIINNVEKGKVNPHKFSKDLDTFYKKSLEIEPPQKNLFKKIKAWFNTFVKNYKTIKEGTRSTAEDIKKYNLKDFNIDNVTKKANKRLTKTTKKFVNELIILKFKNLKTELKTLQKEQKQLHKTK